MTSDSIRQAVRNVLPLTERFLCDIMRFPSTSGQEHEEMEYLVGAFGAGPAAVERCPLSDSLRSDPDYSDPIPGIRYDGRFNLRILKKGTGGGRTVVLNTHTDVVPPSEDMVDPWIPKVLDGVVRGRGACDAKGQVAALFTVFKVLEELGVRLKGDVVGHLVVEEENGGNGSLAMARRGEKADACIVLEPSDGKVFTSIRGAVWFRLQLRGKAGHSGQAGQTRSALLMARQAIAVMEKYHAELLAQSRGMPLFDPYPNPMPITFGHLEAGNWPASAPSKAVLEGVLGFLPNRTKEQICAELRVALTAGGGDLLAEGADLGFMYRHDSSVLEPGHEFPKGLLDAARKAGRPAEISAMTASCDAWFYNNQLGIPTLVYGPGTLKVAHSKDEQISMADIAGAAEVLSAFLLDYCGGSI